MTEPRKLFDMSAMFAGRPVERVQACGGALLRLTRETLETMGLRYASVRDDGRGGLAVRVQCGREAARDSMGNAYALCVTCQGIERAAREAMTELAERGGT